MNSFRINKKKAFIMLLVLICSAVVGSIVIRKVIFKSQDNNTFNRVSGNQSIVAEGKDSLGEGTKEESLVSGEKVIEKYLEIKDKEYAFLIATNAFLEEEKEELVNCDEILYIKYILSKKDQGVVENVYTKNGKLVPLAYINYNAVLDDTCLFQGFSLSHFECRYGFIKNNESTIYGENIQDIFPLVQSKKENIFTIHEEASFQENLIYNNEGLLLGYAYREQ